jgi:hypothetical protein
MFPSSSYSLSFLYTIFIHNRMKREDNAVILRGFVCLMCHLKHFYANKDIKLSFGKVANCFMIFSLSLSLSLSLSYSQNE